VARALVQAGLDHLADQSPYLLSGGERKRLAIAGVLVMQPDVVIFDEPFANLDYPGVRSVLTQIVSLHRQGRTLIIAAHDIEKIFYFAQRLVIMQQGRIVADGNPEALFDRLEPYDIRRPCAARLGLPVDSWLS
jgi:biotin transport system ATP-binding protein